MTQRRGHPRYTGRVPAQPHRLSVIREEVAAIARECGLPDAQVHDIRLAVSEAATNVVKHAYREGPAGDLVIEVYDDADELLVIVADEGVGMKPRMDGEGFGLGLPLIATVAMRMEVLSADPGTEVHMVFPCPHGGRRLEVLPAPTIA